MLSHCSHSTSLPRVITNLDVVSTGCWVLLGTPRIMTHPCGLTGNSPASYVLQLTQSGSPDWQQPCIICPTPDTVRQPLTQLKC